MRRTGRHAAALVAVSAFGLVAAAAPVRSGTASGEYIAQQAEEGARIYAVRCAMCHGARLEGTVETPGLTGKFVANWGGRPLSHLYDYMSAAMPQPAPGSLTPQDNARLMAFILRQNGAPAGKRPLPADSASLRKIRFDPVLPR